MKIKGISFGRGGINDRIDIPGIGNVSEIFLGLSVIDPHGRGTGTVTSMEFEPRGGLILIKRTDPDGKPVRRWTRNQDVKEHNKADFIAIRLGDNMTMYGDDEQPAQPLQKR